MTTLVYTTQLENRIGRMDQKLIRNGSEKDHEWIRKGFGMDQDGSGKDHEWIMNGS